MDLQKLMQQAQMMQKKLEKTQEQLEATEYTGSSNGVEVKMNGKNEVLEISIPDDLMNVEDKEMLQDLLLIALNDANDKVAEDKEKQLGSVTGGLNFPGM